jgi:hypothetical protein
MRFSRKQVGRVGIWGIVACGVLVLAIGDAKLRGLPPDSARANSPAGGDIPPGPNSDARVDTNAPPLRPQSFGVLAARDPPEFADRVRGGSPPWLVAAARALVGNTIAAIWDYNRESEYAPLRLFDVQAKEGSFIFLEKEGRYIWLGANAELMGINEAFSRYRFTKEDFNDPLHTAWFLTEVMRLHEGNSQFTIGCSTQPPGSGTRFRNGEEEALAKEFGQDPKFAFEGDRWKVTFNVFKGYGRVDRWNLWGRHDPNANVNEILRVDISTVRAGYTPTDSPGRIRRLKELQEPTTVGP